MTRSRSIITALVIAAAAVATAVVVLRHRTEDVGELTAPAPSFARFQAEAATQPADADKAGGQRANGKQPGEQEAVEEEPDRQNASILRRVPLGTYRGHTDGVRTAAYSPDGTRVVTASNDRTARIWDAADGRELLRLEGHSGGLYDAAFSPDGTRVATAASDGEAYVWDARTGDLIAMLEDGSAAPVGFVAFTPDGSAMTGSYEGHVCFWDAATGEEIGRHVDEDRGNMVLCGTVSPDGARAVTGGSNGSVVVWDLIARRPLRRHALYPLPPDPPDPAAPPETPAVAGTRNRVDIHGVAVTGDGSSIFAAMGKGRVDRWDAETGRHLARVPRLRNAAAVAVHPTRPILAVANGGTARLFQFDDAGADGEADRDTDADGGFADVAKLPFGYYAHWLAFRRDGEKLLGTQGGMNNPAFPGKWQPALRSEVYEWDVPPAGPRATTAPASAPTATLPAAPHDRR